MLQKLMLRMMILDFRLVHVMIRRDMYPQNPKTPN